MFYLGQLMPELIQVGKDLGMNFGTADIVDISQDTQYPSPKDKCRIGMPTSQGSTCNDADIISQTLTAVCKARETKWGGWDNESFGNIHLWAAGT